MAIQDFTAGQVLTAAQMDSLQANDYNQTVSTKTASYTLVAADKGTRVVMNSASATTITVNTSLFSAGDTLFIQNIGAGVTTLTAGTATVSSAGPLAIPQNGGGLLYFTSAGVSIYYPSAVTVSASGLTLISSTTVGTTVASVTVSNAFSATYDNYKITYSGGVASTGVDLQMTLGATTAGYFFGLGYIPWASSITSITVNNGASFAYIGGASTKFAFINCDIFRPFAADETAVAVLGANDANGQFGGGYLNNSTSYTAFTITTSSGTLTGGTIRVYGYQNS
jgi:hypothetical protein